MAYAAPVVAFTPKPQARVAWRDLLALTRPRVTLVAAITGWPALTLGPASPSAVTLAAILAALVLLSSGCSAFNAWIERDRDRLMTRTRTRPLAARRLRPAAAIVFGAVTTAAGVALLAVYGNAAAAMLGLATVAFYVGPYTVWAKPHTAWSAVVGAFPGAAAPLIADAAVNGSPGLPGWTLFAIVFLWQAPHVWAIELFRAPEYRAAGLPTLPARAGAIVTRRLMFVCATALVPVTIAPIAAGLLGLIYGVVAVAASLYFQIKIAVAVRERHARADRNAFLASLVYICVVFAALIVGPMLR
jgi:protoheme IX farnesyltransferase